MDNKFFVSTGEVSGDLHLSYIVKSISKLDPKCKFFGVAGKHSGEAGVNIIQNIDDLAIMGFVEVVKKYSFLKRKAREYVDFIKKEHIEKVILVDYGGFNLKFMELLKKEAPRVKIYYYIPPKLWVWGEKRIEKLKLADHIIVIFPWEVEFYKKYEVNAVYYGNPFYEKYHYQERTGDCVLLLPGSRKQEVESIFPIMEKYMEISPEKKFILKLSNRDHLKWIKGDLKRHKNLKVELEGSLKNCVKKSEVAVATSGTVTLELALMGIPTVVVYKTSILNELIARLFIKFTYVSLPNLVLGREVFPELLQRECNPKEIKLAVNRILDNKEKVNNEIQKVRDALSGKNILDKYGEFILRGHEDGKI
ncbi:MAG: lipid-A-disaccharide synthase [Fusobacteriaceae bacterium]